MKATLRAAGVYNVVWGVLAALFPLAYFRWLGMPEPNYPQLVQCLGMVVGVYGLAYWVAASDPARHWPVVAAGLLGKILGPVGFLLSAWRGEWPWRAGYTLLTNDLVWWLPFALILLHAYRAARRDRGTS